MYMATSVIAIIVHLNYFNHPAFYKLYIHKSNEVTPECLITPGIKSKLLNIIYIVLQVLVCPYFSNLTHTSCPLPYYASAIVAFFFNLQILQDPSCL